MRKARVGFNIHKLQSEDIGRYNVEVKNKFDALGDIKDPEGEHDKILEMYRDAAKKVIGWSKEQSKPCIGDRMEKNNERKEAELKMEGARPERLKQRRRQEYYAKNKEVKQSARKDKRIWMEKWAAAAKKTAENGQ